MASSSALANFELLIVSNDYPTLKMFVCAWREAGNRLDSTPSIACANDFVQHRKMHGIVVDMAVKGASEFIGQVRKSRGNGAAIIVACAATAQDERAALAAGANFVVQKPFSTGRIFDLLTLNSPIQAPQRRRYLRHRLVAPVTILSQGLQYRALTSDLGPCGMSIRSVRLLGPNTSLKFSFQLCSTTTVAGRGRIMWADDSGCAGIKFDSVRCADATPFPEWLNRHGVLLSCWEKQLLASSH
jgi:CheY-like chemotaxis protein